MKKLIVFSLGLLVSISALAQQESSKSDSKIALGLKAGLTFPAYAISGANPSSIASSAFTSFYAGLTVDIPLLSALSIQPGVLLEGKGSSFSSSAGSGKMTPLYVEVPVNAIVGVEAGPGKFLIGAGPYWAWAVSGKLKVSGGGDRTLNIGSDATDDLKSMDWGINFLLGYQLKMGLALHVGYGLGLTNVQPNSAIDATYKSGVYSAGLGISF